MITRSVTIEDIHNLDLVWNDHINASTSIAGHSARGWTYAASTLTNSGRGLLERAREQGYTLEEITEDANRFADPQSLVEEQQSQPPAGDATDD